MATSKIKEKVIKVTLTLVVLVLIDSFWLFMIMPSFYAKQLEYFARPEVVPVWSAGVAWLLLAIGIELFVSEHAKNFKQAVLRGALFGFVVYGVYDTTNYVILAGWTHEMMFVDIFWGTVLCSLVAGITKKINL